MLLFVILLALSMGAAATGASADAVDVGSRLELMVDEHLIDRMSGGARLQLHRPVRRNVALVTGEPWEGNASFYRTVFQDGNTYRMYYGAWHYETTETGMSYPNRPYLCYAESSDGIRFRKPKLGLVEFRGSTDNNIVLSETTLSSVEADPGHAAVFIDENPDCPEDARYRMIIRSNEREGPAGAQVAGWNPLHPHVGPGRDLRRGLRFSEPGLLGPGAARIPGLLPRVPPEGFRDILTSTSSDFLNWTDPVWCEYPSAPTEHLYTNQLRPYYRAPHILVGFPMRYKDRGPTEATWRLPGREAREHRARVSQRYGTAVSDALLMTGRDRLHFKRWGEAFIRPGPARTDSWVYGDNCIAWGIVQTRSDRVGSPDELSIYVVEGYWMGRSIKVRRYSLRMDGFVSMQAPLAGGEVVTRPLRFDGNRLRLNYSTSGSGGIWVELQDADGKPLEVSARRMRMRSSETRSKAWCPGRGTATSAPWPANRSGFASSSRTPTCLPSVLPPTRRGDFQSPSWGA